MNWLAKGALKEYRTGLAPPIKHGKNIDGFGLDVVDQPKDAHKYLLVLRDTVVLKLRDELTPPRTTVEPFRGEENVTADFASGIWTVARNVFDDLYQVERGRLQPVDAKSLQIPNLLRITASICSCVSQRFLRRASSDCAISLRSARVSSIRS